MPISENFWDAPNTSPVWPLIFTVPIKKIGNADINPTSKINNPDVPKQVNAINIASKRQGYGNKVFSQSRNLKSNPLTSEELKKFNAIIIDPPRSGARSQFLNITLSKVPIVISISCNINTFVRDAKILIENNYQLKWVQPIDQFLFSPHVEIVSLFELNLGN